MNARTWSLSLLALSAISIFLCSYLYAKKTVENIYPFQLPATLLATSGLSDSLLGPLRPWLHRKLGLRLRFLSAPAPPDHPGGIGPAVDTAPTGSGLECRAVSYSLWTALRLAIYRPHG